MQYYLFDNSHYLLANNTCISKYKIAMISKQKNKKTTFNDTFHMSINSI